METLFDSNAWKCIIMSTTMYRKEFGLETKELHFSQLSYGLAPWGKCYPFSGSSLSYRETELKPLLNRKQKTLYSLCSDHLGDSFIHISSQYIDTCTRNQSLCHTLSTYLSTLTPKQPKCLTVTEQIWLIQTQRYSFFILETHVAINTKRLEY